ncbi:MAG: homocysteine S-methyltransferase family protein [Candidatus Peregrinibacteria bacterium]
MQLREAISDGKILLLDGAMGTELAKVGLQGKCDASHTHPGKIIGIHDAYVQAGSQAITTNTFQLNALTPSVERRNLDLVFLNKVAVELARNVAGNDHYVLGGIGPTGRLLEPDGPMTDASCRDAFLAQAKVLDEEGTDGLIIETMTSLREALLALSACREATDKPVIVSMAYKTLKGGGRTLMGDRAVESSQQLVEQGADVVGTNCGEVLISEMAQIIAAIRAVVTVPIVAQPNAGQPHGVESIYDMTPKEFAVELEKCRQAGATLLGGCCGAGPECIEKVKERVRR